MNDSDSVNAVNRCDFTSNKSVIILAALLALQVGLVALLGYTRTSYQATEPTANLIETNLNVLTSIAMADGDRPAGGKMPGLFLKKSGSIWKMPDFYDFPVSPIALQQFLDKLRGLKRGLPLATTPDAFERFRVGKEKFSRKITLSYGNKETVLYMGAAPLAHTSYARVDGSNNVYSVDLPVYQLSLEPDAWINKDCAATKLIDVTFADLGSLQLERIGGLWMMTAGQDKHQVSNKIAQSEINKLAGLRISGVLGTENQSRYHTEKPALTCKVKLKDGTALQYSFSKEEGKSSYVLKRSDMPQYMSVESFIVQQIRDIKAADIIKRAEEEEKKQEASKEKEKKPAEQNADKLKQ